MASQASRQIDRASVIRLFENNDFDLVAEGGVNNFVYSTQDGFRLSFAAPWLMNDDSMYNLGSARRLMTKMLASVKHEHEVYKKLTDKVFCQKLISDMSAFGVMYYEPEDLYIYNDASGKTLFSADLDYIVSLMVINPSMTVKDILEGMKDDAMKQKGSTDA